MSDLLIVGTAILAVGPFTVTADSIISPDIVYPIAVIPGYQIVSALLPPDFSISTYEWVAGVLQKKVIPVPPYPSPEANEALILDSFNASLKREAAKLQEEGKSFEAVQLLLQANGVQQ